MAWNHGAVVALIVTLSLAVLALISAAKENGRIEACAHVCGGPAEWQTIGDGCVCVVREEVTRGR